MTEAHDVVTASTSAGSSAEAEVREVVGRLAHAVDERLDPGDVAALRRLGTGDPGGPAFWKLVATHLEPRLPRAGEARDAGERAWAVILCGMALTAGLNRRGMRSGSALAAAGVAEGRFTRLLRAEGPRLADEIRAAARQLASSGTRVNWTELARLVLASGGPGVEPARRALARDYYRALHSAAKPAPKTND